MNSSLVQSKTKPDVTNLVPKCCKGSSLVTSTNLAVVGTTRTSGWLIEIRLKMPNMLPRFIPKDSTTRRLRSNLRMGNLFFLLPMVLCGNLVPTDIATVLLVGEPRVTLRETTKMRKSALTPMRKTRPKLRMLKNPQRSLRRLSPLKHQQILT